MVSERIETQRALNLGCLFVKMYSLEELALSSHISTRVSFCSMTQKVATANIDARELIATQSESLHGMFIDINPNIKC